MDKQTAMWHIRKGKIELVDKKFLTPRILLERETPEGYYIDTKAQPLIIEVISLGHLPKLPKKLLSRNLLAQEVGYTQGTILQEVASHGYLYCIPKGLLTAKTLLVLDNIGNNCLYYACESGEITIMPKSILNTSNLTRKNKRGRNCMHQLSKSGNLNCIAGELVNEKTMLGDDPKGQDPIDEFYTYCIGMFKTHLTVTTMMKGFSDASLIYLTKKDYIISHLATKILKKRRADNLSTLINQRAKEWQIPD